MSISPEKIAKEIYHIAGPRENILKAYNCMTRLRLVLRQVPEDFQPKISAIEGVLGFNVSGDEYQIILGPGRATAVEAALAKILKEVASPATESSAGASQQELKGTIPNVNSSRLSNLAKESQAAGIGNGQALHDAIRARNATPVKLFLKRIASIFVPLIPAFIACGLITGLTNVAMKISPEIASYPMVKLLSIMGSAVFWGMNLFVGCNAAKEFGGSPIIGGVLAAIMSHPGLSGIVLLDEPLTPGRGGIISVLLVAGLGAVLEQKLGKIIPEIVSLFMTPLLTILIAGMAAIWVLQPIGAVISEAIGTTVEVGISQGGALTGFVLGGTFLPMVMLGIHQALTPIHAELLARSGVTILLPTIAMAGAGQIGASLAVYCKTKNKRLKKTIASALPVGILGVGEPLIYGVTLPLGKPFIGAGIGGACGGAIQAANMVGAGAMGISGLPLAAVTDNIPVYLIGLFTAYAVAFVATWIIGFDDPAEE